MLVFKYKNKLFSIFFFNSLIFTVYFSCFKTRKFQDKRNCELNIIKLLKYLKNCKINICEYNRNDFTTSTIYN